MIRRSTFILLLIFIVLMGAVFLFQRTEEQKEAQITPTEENPLIFNFEDEIKGITVEHVGSGAVDLSKDEDGAWTVKAYEDEEVDVAAVESAISQLLSLRAVSSLGSEITLEEAGLEPAVYRVMIRLADGSISQMLVGRETPTSSGYYVKIDEREIYVVSTFSLDPFLSLVDAPPLLRTPTPLSTEDMEPQLLQAPTSAP